ncbi:hypothetical protein TNIN_373761 [Trichonephila inaurata madagascariensis]|uniref:Uncharacterized protein n=1 Tax=Trichonephila inaurata madagascariensis TaxID=2747483 RepID=A0A8X6YM59_9ARAC|nr:hypothetical protein TNIN_373761 [Trichonephila inaurata madagascariensis]
MGRTICKWRKRAIQRLFNCVIAIDASTTKCFIVVQLFLQMTSYSSSPTLTWVLEATARHRSDWNELIVKSILGKRFGGVSRSCENQPPTKSPMKENSFFR